MKFFRMEMLFFAWTIPVLWLVTYYGMRKRRAILSRYSSERGLTAIAPDTGARRRRLKAALLLISIFFTVLSLSGPQVGYRWQEIKQKGVDIIIAIDCSRSMLGADISPTRLERAKRKIYDLIALLKGDRVGIVAFAGTAFLQCPLTLDYSAFHIFLDALEPDFLPVGGTDITGALSTAADAFEKDSETEKAVILITDGENTGSGDPVAAAEALKEKGVRLFCIGVGNTDGVPVPDANGGFKKDDAGKIVLSKLDEASLKQMAVVTGGAYVRSVAGDMDLELIYEKEIRGKMEAAEVSSGRKQVWENRFQWPLAAALLCLLLELAVPVSKKTGKVMASILVLLIIPMAGKAVAGPASEGMAAYEAGDYEKAVKSFIDAQLENPEKPGIAFNIGNAYYKSGDYPSAMANYEQALNAKDPQLRQKALYNMGNAAFRMGNSEKAIEHYQAALKISPEDRLAKENLAFVKKAMQQKPPPNQQGNGDKKEPSDKQKKNDAKGEKGSHRKEDQNKKDNESESGEKKADSEKSQDSSGQRKQKADENASSSADGKRQDQHAESTFKNGNGSGTKDAARAEQMLNRLKDRPGRALMPAYQKKTVERDW